MYTVVIADDHPLFRDGIRSVIEADSHFTIVGEAGTAETAVAATLNHRPSIAVIDMAMPGFSGAECTRKIRQHDARVRILILSMHHEAHYVLAALRAGANGYLLKDSARDELVTALRSLVRGGRYLSPAIEGLARRSGDDDALRQYDPVAALSKREREVLIAIASGQSTKSISRTLRVSPRTVATHREHLMQKTDLHTAVDLTRFAIGAGLVSLSV